MKNLLAFCSLILFVLAASLPGVAPITYAQTILDLWTPPKNLSESGAANQPVMVEDDVGRFHFLWLDSFAGFVYMTQEGDEWSDAVGVTLPFDETTPMLVSDLEGLIHAFWNGPRGELYYSRAASDNFANLRAWSSPVILAELAVAFDAELDASGRLHLAYVRPIDSEQAPAGVYYRNLPGRGNAWSAALSLFTTPYFRSLTQEDAHIDVTTGSGSEQQYIYVAWDNRPRERVFIIASDDGGNNWGQQIEVDRPSEGAIASGPSNINTIAYGVNNLVIWQSGQTETNCIQYYQLITDGGATWGPRQRMLDDIIGCPQNNQLLKNEQGLIVLMTTINEQTYLLVWDGKRWSNPQAQRQLTSFIDPDTQRTVSYACRQASLTDDNRLAVVGCDTGLGGDIWWMERPLVDLMDWFPLESVWSPAATISTNSLEFLDPVMVADMDGRIHLLWSHPAGQSVESPGMVLYYARFEDGLWSGAVPVLTSPEGKAEQPAAAVDSDGRLLVVWSGGEGGEIYFSRVSRDQGMVATAWSTPVRLPSPQPAGSSPDILVDQRGTIYVTYAVPLNEERGIYLTHSADGGQTWAEPVRVFDAVSANWAMVDLPRLAFTENGRMHLLWSRLSLPSGTGPLELYYSRSNDWGDSWTPAEMVIDRPAVWSQLIGFRDLVVHRLWGETVGGRSTLWHEMSSDGGISWMRIAPVSIFGDTAGIPDLTWDSAGRLHLLLVISRNLDSYAMQHWIWDGERWSIDQGLDLGVTGPTTMNSMTSTITNEGTFFTIFSAKTLSQEINPQQNFLMFSNRMMIIPDAIETNRSLATSIPPAKPTSTLTPTVEPTPTLLQITPTVALDELINESVEPNNPWLGSLVGLVAAGLVIFVAIMISFRLRRDGRS